MVGKRLPMTAWFRENRTAILAGVVFGVFWLLGSWADGGWA